MMGTAVSPNGRPLPEMLVALSVAKRRKVVRVIGDRCWKPRGAGFSAAKPFDAMPLVYERAFGGTHRLDDGHVVATDQRNPVGTGFAGQRSPNDMGGRSLPNLEDPRRPIQYATDQPPPACFGFVAPSWMPRRMYAGTYDDAWRRDRAPYLPLDFDRHFFNVAPADMTFARPLQGGEPVEVDGAGRRGPLRFALPQVCPAVAVQIAGARHAAPAALETVLIEADDGRLGLTWRAAVPCDKSALKIQAVVIEMSESR
jgi:hypothetical protein